MILADALREIYPDAVFTVTDERDGKGQRVAAWEHSKPVPTSTEIAAAWERVRLRRESEATQRANDLATVRASLNPEVQALVRLLGL